MRSLLSLYSALFTVRALYTTFEGFSAKISVEHLKDNV